MQTINSSITLLLVFGLVFFVSCNNEKVESKHNGIENKIQQEKEKDKTTIYNQEEYLNNSNKKIIVVDTICPFKTKQAKNDIKEGKLSLHFWYFNFTKTFIGENENKQMENLLSKYKIAVDTSMEDMSCIRTDGFTQFCYQSTMKKEIERKFGLKFIDSLRNSIEKNYVIKYPDKIYDMQDCDHKSIYPDKKKFKDFFVEFDEYFEKNFVYPQEYKYKNEKYFSYTDMDFIIEKDGSISNLKVESTFQNIKNEKFKKHFENYIKNRILKIKWTPASSCGIIVRSNFRNVVFHK